MKEARICKTCARRFVFNASPSKTGRGIYCSQSCRCRDASTRHGHTVDGKQSRTYVTWVNMVRRCTDPRHDKFEQYGAAGITVCERWMTFDNFLADMGERPENDTIDRIEGHIGYEPGNCRWAPIKTQQRNLRSNVILEFNGERKCVAEWAEELGLDRTIVAWRIRKGWSVEQALTTKPKRGNRIKAGLHTKPFLVPDD